MDIERPCKYVLVDKLIPFSDKNVNQVFIENDEKDLDYKGRILNFVIEFFYSSF